MKTLFCFIFAFILSGVSFADTYKTQWLDSDAGRYFYGMDDIGHVVFLRSGTTLCSRVGDDCYETFLAGQLVGYSSVAPAFDWDYAKGACGYPYACSISDNGRSVDIANWDTVHYGTNLSQVLHGEGFGGIFAINGVGDIILDDQFGDLWEEIVDISSSPAIVHAFSSVFTPAPVPEPTSILFFGTSAVFLFISRPRKEDVTP